jgi:threonine dehydratase
VTPTIDRERIERTHSLIRPHIRLTPVMELTGADFGLPAFPLTLVLVSGGNTTAVDFGR